MFAFPSTLFKTPSDAACATGALDLQALVGAAGWARLPAAVRRRFAAGHADVRYAGSMELHCSAAGWAYALLARVFGGPLPGVRRRGVATTVEVQADGRGGVVWTRCFHRGDGRPGQVVRSTKALAADGTLLERTDGGLSMSLEVYEDDGALVFESRRFWLLLGAMRLPVPAWLTPGRCRVAHIDLGQGRFRFTLTMVHPLWGETFRQTGVFIDPSYESQP